MEFGLLDGLKVTAEGVDLTPSRRQERVLLACLLLRPGEVVPFDDLVEAVWGDQPPDTSLTALYGHISKLRQRLGAQRIETRPHGYLVRLQEADELDVLRFERLVAGRGAEDPAVRASALRTALTLFPGEPLAELRYEPFARHAASRLSELRLIALEQRIEADLELGRHLDVLAELQQLVADHPEREGLRSLLMLALYRAGRQADALRAAQEGRRLLADEFGVDPGPALQRLEQQILNHDPQLLAPALSSEDAERATPAKPNGIVTFMAVAFDSAPGPPGPTADRAGRGIEAQLEMARAVTRRLGFEVEARGTSVQFAFARARDAAAAATALQRSARMTGARVRVGLHSAEVMATPDGYAGLGSNLAIQIAAAARPGQVVLSRETRELLREAPADEANVRDLGEHRLADLERARQLFQLDTGDVRGEFPPLLDLESRRTNLPVQAEGLIGRRTEIREVAELLGEPGLRLLTLVGPGGTGKTRLAAHAAAALLDGFPEGVFFVDLAPLRDPDLVPSTIARVLGLEEAAGEPVTTTLARHLGGKRLLLVLDNMEHLLAASPAVAGLLADNPGLTVLATSRSALRLELERTYPVPPLAVPRDMVGVDGAIAADAIALFIARARSVRADFTIGPSTAEAISEICRVLDGLPLAIELAAARTSVMDPASLLERLRGHRDLLAVRARGEPGRHRTLDAAIDWSYDLLEPGAQTLLRRLGVFSGGCTLEAAEEVCGADDDRGVIDGLSDLVDASLIRLHGPEASPRFVLLETVRDYAARRLEQTGEAEGLRRRHAAYYMALAERAEPHLRGNPGEWLERLDLEHDNLRMTFDRLAAARAGAEELRLTALLWRFWYLKGYLAEGRQRVEAALLIGDGAAPDRAQVTIGAAVMAVNAGDSSVARQRAEAGIRLHEELQDAWGRTYCQFMLGAASGAEGDLARAADLYVASIQSFRELHDEHTALLVSRNLAVTYHDLGDRTRARELLEDNLRLARLTGNQRIEASTLGALASAAFDAGRIQDSVWMLQESLRLHRELGDRLDTVVDLGRAARSLALAGKAGVAVRLVSSLGQARNEIGVRGLSVGDMNEQTLAIAHRQLAEAEFTQAWSRGLAMTLGEALDVALDALD